MLESWAFKVRERVHIKPGTIGYCAELHDVVYDVVGVSLDRNGRQRVHISQDWPHDGGTDDMDPADLVSAAHG